MIAPFSILVIGDTQYLFDGDRKRPDLLDETFAEVARLSSSGAISPVAHAIHVGDVTEHGWPDECRSALHSLSRGAAQLGGTAMTIATGNHDVANDSRDDRGRTPFLDAFGPGCALLTGAGLAADVPSEAVPSGAVPPGAVLAAPVSHGPGGYSSFRRLSLPGGGQVGVLALDWRPTSAGWDWAGETLRDNATIPTIVVSHDVALDAALTAQGRLVEDLLSEFPQVFLVVGGHEWPSTRVVTPEREYHAVNYQQLPFGGAGAARIYDFDPRRGICRVISVCPSLRRPEILASTAARRLLALSGDDDQFAFPLVPPLGAVHDETPWQATGMDLVIDIQDAGAVQDAGIRLPGRFVIEIECDLPARIPDGWQVFLCRVGAAPDGSPEPLAAVSLSTENFVGWQAYTATGGETWATSHAQEPGARVRIVVANGDDAGVWVDGDAVGRVDHGLRDSLAAGAWSWRVGEGWYGDRHTDRFTGAIHRVRAWAAD